MSHESVERVRPPLVADEPTMLHARHNGHADLLRERLDGAVGE